MSIIFYNFDWMFFNIVLASIPLVTAWLIYIVKNIYFRMLLAIIWLFFVPNTIYILTDIIHFPRQYLYIQDQTRFYLIFQYVIFMIIGILAFYFAILPMHLLLNKHYRKYSLTVIFLLHFLIAFGVTMGRFLRTNSWYVITHPFRVMRDVAFGLQSPELLFFTFMFGIVSSTIYFFLYAIFHLNQKSKKMR